MFTLNFRCRPDTRDPPKDWSWADMPLPACDSLRMRSRSGAFANNCMR
eukprot:SAG25_NODE_7338_length_487_cov_0.664948_1_plen_47_part_10